MRNFGCEVIEEQLILENYINFDHDDGDGEEDGDQGTALKERR